MTSKNERKLDIFQLMGEIDKKNRDYCKTLTEEQLKEFAPFVVMRWLTGTSNPLQVYFLNEIVNPYAFSLPKHKELLMKLMMICTSGKKQRYKWVKSTTKRVKYTTSLHVLVKRYFGCSGREADNSLPNLTDEDLLSYAEQLAYQPDELKILKKDLKKRGKV